MNLYMRVTQDKYSLPLDFDASPRALTRRLGEPQETLFTDVWRQKKGILKGNPRYICIEIDDDNWLDIMIDTIKENERGKK